MPPIHRDTPASHHHGDVHALTCRTRAAEPGTTLSLMVLADGPEGCAAVDTGSGALVRAAYAGAPQAPLMPYDLVHAVLAEDPDGPDPTQPEAVTLVGPPEVVGRLRGRRARRLIEPLLLPSGEQPLGFPGTAVPYWLAPRDRPSLAVLAPQRGPTILRRGGDTALACRFRWRDTDQELPLADRLARRVIESAPWARLAGTGLARTLGFDPRHLVVALSRPQDGRCYKVVAGLLPSP